MSWFISVLAIGMVALGVRLDRKRLRERASIPRPDLHRWEEEGGAMDSPELTPGGRFAGGQG